MREAALEHVEGDLAGQGPLAPRGDETEARAGVEEAPDTVTTELNIAAALTEMRRVLKPTGHLIFCDHGRSHDRDVALLQDRIDPYWQQIRGSHLNRDLVVLLDDAGFRIEMLDTFYALRRPKVLGFHYVGSAVLAG